MRVRAPPRPLYPSLPTLNDYEKHEISVVTTGGKQLFIHFLADLESVAEVSCTRLG